MMDLLSIVPYYTAHLCAALAYRTDVDVEIGSIRYYLDPNCFARLGLRLSPGPLDVVSRFAHIPSILRRVLKTIECTMNMAWLAMRFAFDKPDIVHVQFLPLVLFGLPFEVWLLSFAHRRGIKIVYTVHNVLPHDTGERHRRLYQRLYTLADRLICHDAAAKQRLVERFGQEASRISIVPHGQLHAPESRNTQPEARRRLGFSAYECVVLWQGILAPYKGVGFLLDAWRTVSAANPQARLAVVGGGDERVAREIRDKVESLGLNGSVRLELRFITVPELEDFHSAADILVYPYADATTSGALMTGIGFGKAIIATRTPAFEQILQHDDNALLISYGDTNEFSGELNRLIGDTDLRRRLGERLRRSKDQITSWETIAAMTASCYAAASEVTS
jgi:glycosyltransferase involved in cell wall biosynthesis